MDMEAARFLGAGLAVFSLFGVGLAVGKIFCTLIQAVGRNPDVKDSVVPLGILGFAVTEAIALFALLVAFLILYK